MSEDIGRVGPVEQLGIVLRQRRRALGLSQDAVCATAGVARSWLARVESGTHGGAEVQKVLDLARVLGLEVSLREADGEPPAPAPTAPAPTAPSPPPSQVPPPGSAARREVRDDPFEHLFG